MQADREAFCSGEPPGWSRRRETRGGKLRGSWLLLALLAVCLASVPGAAVPQQEPAKPAPVDPKAPEDPSGEYFPGVKPKLLKQVRDNTTFRNDERHAWFNLLGVLQKTPEPELEKASLGPVTYLQLFEQTNEYRGKLVGTRARVRRVLSLKAPQNELGIERYWQLVVQPEDARDFPIMVYCLELPEGFPTGKSVVEEAEITGFCFKRWVYPAADALRTAPVLVAKTLRWIKKPSSVAQQQPAGDDTAKPAPAAATAEEPAEKEPAEEEPAEEEPAEEEPAEEEPVASGKITGPRDLLRRYGIDDSRFDRFLDGRPLHVDEVETLLRILLRVDDFRLEDMDRWARRKLDPAELAAEPGPERGQIFPVEGRVVNVETRHPEPEIVRLYDMPQYYRCEFVLAGSEQPAVVYTRTVPSAWKDGGTMDQRASAMGLFLKLGREDPKRPVPVFAARRVAWYPPGLLGDLGFDAGLLDDMQDKEELLQEEREAFYQMLAAVRRAEPGQLRREADKQIAKMRAEGTPEEIRAKIYADTDSDSVVPLFREPAKCRGELVVVTGDACKVVLIRVDDPDIRSRFGIDHYYQVSVITLDSQGHPLVFCVPELPEGMPAWKSTTYAETVRVAGFFLKTWAYRVPPPSDVPRSETETKIWKRQAPLLIAHELRWYPREKPPSTTLAGAIAGALFVVALLGIWLAIWRYNRGDKAFHEKTIARSYAADTGISLDELGLDADGKPDFSALEGFDESASAGEEPPAGGDGDEPSS